MLFTDIEGSTRLLQQVGDRYPDVLAKCRSLLRTAFREWGGHEVDIQGDAFFVAFARATDAVLAAVDAQRALAAHAFPEGVAVCVRMGLHTGEPARTSEGYVGLDVHRAARIMSAAHGGQVLLSQTTANLVEQDLPEDLSLRDLGEHRLKDLGRPRRLFQLVISGLPADFPVLKTLDVYPNNLPMQHTPFIGREQELAAVGHLLSREDVRLVTLSGPGGTGKTRLGLQVTAELTDSFAGGVFFVNLAPVNDTELVMPTIAETLGMREAGGQPLRERLKGELQQKQMLLLLDNFEQVVSSAMQVVELLDACPRLKVLVTSREALHVRAEQEFTVPPFPLPNLKHLPDLTALSHNAAVALFVSRAQAVKPDFQVTSANARALVEICVRLDGLPLAIELAAARMKLFSPQALLARLSQRLAVLTSGARDAPARQQTLRNTIAWSYHLLHADEQQLFRRLSIFVGGCTLEAIEAVHAAPHDGSGQVLEGVASLIDKSLLQQTEQEGGEPRLVMLETIREYGQEVFAASGEVEVIQRAHAAYYLALVKDAAHRPTHAGKGRSWLEQLQREHENLRVALEWLVEHEEQEAVLQESGTLCWFWWAGGHLSEGQALLARALSAGEQGMAMAVRAKGLNALGRLAAVQGDLDRADAVCGESLTLFRVLEDTQGIATSLGVLGYVTFVGRSNYAAARSLLEEAVALFREVDDREGLGWPLTLLASVLFFQGKYAEARSLLEEGVVLFREGGDSWSMVTSLWLLALVFLSQGDPRPAEALLEESLALSRQEGFQVGIATSLAHLGQVALLQGDVVKAHSFLEESLEIFKGLGERQDMLIPLGGLATVSFVQGDFATARALLEECLALSGPVGGNTFYIANCLVELGAVVAAQGEAAWATRLLGAAEALCEAITAVLPPPVRAMQELSIAAVRAQLGDDACARALMEGRTMTPGQALAARGPVTIPAAIPTEQPSPPSMKPATTYPDGLTAREVEVLRLLAQGLTDAQIAKQLIISPRTVNTHLTSIYGKIQVSSRSAATRYAVDHTLI
jgi:predicted ATPase/class 3 adenylate cyclase/DNA-binding CsgD family transcriptional regulator